MPLLSLYGLLTVEWKWQTALLAFSFFIWCGMGVTAGYHRLFSHNSFNAHCYAFAFFLSSFFVSPRSTQYTGTLQWWLALGGTGSLQGSVKWWSLLHRYDYTSFFLPYTLHFFFALPIPSSALPHATRAEYRAECRTRIF